MSDTPEEVTTDEATLKDVQPPTTGEHEWARESRRPIFGGGGKGDDKPPSTGDPETREQD